MEHERRPLQAVIECSGISEIRCVCGRSSRHVIDEFLESLDRAPGSLVEKDWMEGHVLIQSFMEESAPAVARILMSALPVYPLGEARQVLLESLMYLSGGDSDELVDRCQEVIVRGAWLFLEEISSGRSTACASYAFEILEILGEDEWVSLSRAHFSDLLPQELMNADHT
jgi:hypothetical protein